MVSIFFLKDGTAVFRDKVSMVSVNGNILEAIVDGNKTEIYKADSEIEARLAYAAYFYWNEVFNWNPIDECWWTNTTPLYLDKKHLNEFYKKCISSNLMNLTMPVTEPYSHCTNIMNLKTKVTRTKIKNENGEDEHLFIMDLEPYVDLTFEESLQALEIFFAGTDTPLNEWRDKFYKIFVSRNVYDKEYNPLIIKYEDIEKAIEIGLVEEIMPVGTIVYSNKEFNSKKDIKYTFNLRTTI